MGNDPDNLTDEDGGCAGCVVSSAVGKGVSASGLQDVVLTITKLKPPPRLFSAILASTTTTVIANLSLVFNDNTVLKKPLIPESLPVSNASVGPAPQRSPAEQKAHDKVRLAKNTEYADGRLDVKLDEDGNVQPNYKGEKVDDFFKKLEKSPIGKAAFTTAAIYGGEGSALLKTGGRSAKGEITVYRVFGGDSRAQGYSWTTANPTTLKNFRDVAGLPSGGASGSMNTANFMIKGKVNANNIIKTRSALPLDGNVGGLPELIIDPKNVRLTDFRVIKP
jgi:hypothetical protein